MVLSPKRHRPWPWLAPGVFAGALVPLAALLARAARGTLGADPIAEALNELGLLALVFLVAALGCTPAKALLGWTWPLRLRRMLGLFAFFYASLHLLTYAALDQGFGWAAIAADVTKRKFIFVGVATFVLLVPLAVTSTNGAVRRLGYARWKRLHRLAYVAPALAVLHFLWRVKRDVREPVAYAAVLGALLLLRLTRPGSASSGARRAGGA
ncbi:MAG TPA: protein-methionine-sulfoxide reductase heme-binding subunit MsrQ [Candidatus Binatia bacterium]|nr:protein-methionine-sulfoxide reductase heme-binding subunit MsrQ [Candidatus Binatia bacterium]